MRLFYLTLVLFVLFHSYKAIPNLIGTDIQKCIICLCHARTGCFNRRNCAHYSITPIYWKTAGSPSISTDACEILRYQKCMQDENCIANTIYNYTEGFGKPDINNDGKFDCKDRLAIHFFWQDEKSVSKDSTLWKAAVRRYNTCIKENEEVGTTSLEENEFTLERFYEPDVE